MQVLCGLQVLFLLFNCQTPEQIVNTHYEEELKNEGVDRILKYRIACYKKRCKVQLIGEEEGIL